MLHVFFLAYLCGDFGCFRTLLQHYIIGLLSLGHHFDFLLLQQGLTVAPNQWMLGELVGLAALVVDPVYLLLHFPLVYRLTRRIQEATSCRRKCYWDSVEILILFSCNSEEGLVASFNRLIPFIQSEVSSVSYRLQHK